jgi:hypothetical protein
MLCFTVLNFAFFIVMFNFITMNVVMLSSLMLNVVMPGVIMLSEVAPMQVAMACCIIYSTLY